MHNKTTAQAFSEASEAGLASLGRWLVRIWHRVCGHPGPERTFQGWRWWYVEKPEHYHCYCGDWPLMNSAAWKQRTTAMRRLAQGTLTFQDIAEDYWSQDD